MSGPESREERKQEMVALITEAALPVLRHFRPEVVPSWVQGRGTHRCLPDIRDMYGKKPLERSSASEKGGLTQPCGKDADKPQGQVDRIEIEIEEGQDEGTGADSGDEEPQELPAQRVVSAENKDDHEDQGYKERTGHKSPFIKREMKKHGYGNRHQKQEEHENSVEGSSTHCFRSASMSP